MSEPESMVQRSQKPTRKTPRRSAAYRPNPKRMAVLAVIAVVAMGAGYGVASLLGGSPAPEVEESAPPPSPPPSPPRADLKAWYQDQKPPPELVRQPDAPLLPDAYAPTKPGEPQPVYEEALPETVHPPVERTTEAPVTADDVVQGGTPATPAEVAGLPPVPETREGPTPIEQHAVRPKRSDGKQPKIAIVIDDMGLDRKHSRQAVALPGPLTLSYLSYADDLAKQTRAAKKAGHELMLHVAMQPLSDSVDPGPHVLLTEHTANEIRSRMNLVLDRFEGYVGINNHMGSKFTADPLGMAVVMEQLKVRGLMFLDSRTAPESVGALMAERYGVPVLERNVFLDNVGEVKAVLARLDETERFAAQYGHAIAIGHPRAATIKALRQWLPGLAEKGYQLVPISALLPKDALRMTEDKQP